MDEDILPFEWARNAVAKINQIVCEVNSLPRPLEVTKPVRIAWGCANLDERQEALNPQPVRVTEQGKTTERTPPQHQCGLMEWPCSGYVEDIELWICSYKNGRPCPVCCNFAIGSQTAIPLPKEPERLRELLLNCGAGNSVMVPGDTEDDGRVTVCGVETRLYVDGMTAEILKDAMRGLICAFHGVLVCLDE